PAADSTSGAALTVAAPATPTADTATTDATGISDTAAEASLWARARPPTDKASAKPPATRRCLSVFMKSSRERKFGERVIQQQPAAARSGPAGGLAGGRRPSRPHGGHAGSWPG